MFTSSRATVNLWIELNTIAKDCFTANPEQFNLYSLNKMKLQDLMQQGNITIAVSLSDLKDFAQELIQSTKKELEQQITHVKTETYPSPEQVAKILNVDRSTLWRWHKKGYLCHTDVGGKRRYKMSDVKSLLNGKETRL